MKFLTAILFLPLIVHLIGGCSRKTSVDVFINAAEEGDVAECVRLVNSGMSVNAVDKDGCTALDWAVYGAQPNVVSKLIDLGSDVNHVDHAGNTPLRYTAWGLRGKGRYGSDA